MYIYTCMCAHMNKYKYMCTCLKMYVYPVSVRVRECACAQCVRPCNVCKYVYMCIRDISVSINLPSLILTSFFFYNLPRLQLLKSSATDVSEVKTMNLSHNLTISSNTSFQVDTFISSNLPPSISSALL